jgi:lipoprotein-anchoring transpeptidase ErfK/SrfK
LTLRSHIIKKEHKKNIIFSKHNCAVANGWLAGQLTDIALRKDLTVISKNATNLRIAPVLAAIALLLPSLAIAQGAPVSSPVEFAQRSESLKPGQWVWTSEIAPKGPVLVYVDLGRQTAAIYRNGIRIAVTTVSTGKPGHSTPTGVFTILQKDAKHRSSTYNNAPMPYQQRLTWDGVALHAGGLPGYPESHGCVHLPIEFARKLFSTTEMGGTVVISGQTGVVGSAVAAGVLANADYQGRLAAHDPLSSTESYRWQPELAPTGPLSIIISRGDQRIVVLRNGVEIGRARIEVSRTETATHVFSYSGTLGDKPHWIIASVPGHEAETTAAVDPLQLEKVRMPQQFYTNLRSVIVPGTSILVTQAPVLPDRTGQKLTILSAVKAPRAK